MSKGILARLLLGSLGMPRLLPVQVRQLSELSQINERCLELQRNKASTNSSSKRHSSPANTVIGFSGAPRPSQQQQQRRQRQRSSKGKSGGCPYLSAQGGAAAWDDFRDLVLSASMDVEELASLGSKMKVAGGGGSGPGGGGRRGGS